ncbi:MAG: DUF6470 family protein [Oscillospiraceae bacterium]|jgi:hypothetical protein|nr:DUF6470 family protein [Oscillospiraceae bacterium]
MAGISRIIIEQQLASIGVKVTPAQLQITARTPEMEITSEMPMMEVERENPTFQVVWEKPGEDDALLLTPGVLAGPADAPDILSPGEEPDAPKREESVTHIAERALRHMRESAKRDLNRTLTPKTSPKIEWDPGSVDINWSNHRIKIEWDGEFMPELTVDPPYSVEVYLSESPYFRITVEEGEVPPETGLLLDETI